MKSSSGILSRAAPISMTGMSTSGRVATPPAGDERILERSAIQLRTRRGRVEGAGSVRTMAPPRPATRTPTTMSATLRKVTTTASFCIPFAFFLSG